MQTVKVPQLAWYGARDMELSLPDDWQVEICRMAGYNRPALTDAELREAIRNPIGSMPLRELARNKKEVVIVFDDLSRVTRAAKIVPFILEELTEAGIPDDNIQFICGLALHGAMNRTDFAKKLGEDVVSRFRVFNHNPFGNCVYVGTTNTLGTKVAINEEYMKCDLKIAIGSVVPHPVAGFGGGSKLILPGLSSYETIIYNHDNGGAEIQPLDRSARPTQGMGIIDENKFRKDLDEAASLAGIDFLANAVVNMWGDAVSLYTGDWQQAYAAAVEDAKENYRTPVTTGKDIVISNSYAKASESMIALAIAVPLVSEQGGDIVLVANAPEGQVPHYLVGIFGKSTFALQYAQCRIPDNVNTVISYTEYPHRGSSWFEDHKKILYMRRWDEVLANLMPKHGPGTKVAVIADATIQYFDWYR